MVMQTFYLSYFDNEDLDPSGNDVPARRRIRISEADVERYRRLPRETELTAVVWDAVAREWIAVRPAPCGAGCHCAMDGFTLDRADGLI